MTDIQAAIGRVQLKRLPEIVAAGAGWPRATPTLLGRSARPAPAGRAGLGAHQLAELTACALPEGADQRAVMQALLDRGIATRRGVMNIHAEKPYEGADAPLPRSAAAQTETILLPFFTQMTDEDSGPCRTRRASRPRAARRGG